MPVQIGNYLFADPAKAFAEAERRIQRFPKTGVRNLDLKGLGLEDVPASVGELVGLTILDLSTNKLETFPLNVLELRELAGLDLGFNRLSSLPEGIGKMALRGLWLHDNQLRSLPEGILDLNLNQLDYLTLEGNDALGLPPEILRQGPGRAKPAAILEYYFRSRDGARPLNEAKLIILGRGEVGKTALVNRLVHDEFKRTEMTKGIAITQWHVATGEARVRLNIWDFGGQEIQHATHQFFLTERSLYLVVLNGRAGAEDEDAEYWLKFIKTFGGSSPTIVVLNKFKIQPFEVNRRALREKYSFISAFVETDCEPDTGNGRLELMGLIEEAVVAMEHVRANFPAGWFRIKERLAGMQARGESFISFEEFRRICAELGEKDAVAQERLAGSLNALGIALNFRDDPQLREETVLNPHWITEGVYRLLTSERLAKRKGELLPEDMKAIFAGDPAYPLRMHAFLTELMKKFELCFAYEQDEPERRHLVPEALGKGEARARSALRPATVHQPALRLPAHARGPAPPLHYPYPYHERAGTALAHGRGAAVGRLPCSRRGRQAGASGRGASGRSDGSQAAALGRDP